MTAAVLRRPGGPFVIERLQIRGPRRGEVLVRIATAGMCHTDLVVRDRVPAGPLPIVLGHEGAGVVERVGPGVDGLAVGDPVVLSFAHCGHCRSCAGGQPAYCHDFVPLNFGGGDATGQVATRTLRCEPVHDHFFGQSSFATLALARAASVVKVPAGLPVARMGPMGCGLQTGAGCVLNSLRLQPGQSFAVFGAGTVGLAAIMAAKLVGAGPIVAVDLVDSRLRLARELGATHVVNAASEDPVAAILGIGCGVDASLECTGVPAVLQQAVACLAIRGVCGLIGASGPGAELRVPLFPFKMGGRTLRGITEGDSVPQRFIPDLMRFHAEGRFPFDRFVTVYDLADINQAAADSLAGRVVKPILRMPA